MNVSRSLGLVDRGGFGDVDKVVCDDGKIYARKTFKMNIPHNEQLKDNARERFKREAIYQASFKHKNIVPILFQDLNGDCPYYIMPYASSSLTDVRFDNTEDIMKMLFDVMSGLEEMHNRGFYHRDLKPGNILGYEDEEGSYYAVGDFGLLSIDQTNITDLTPVSMKKGTDYYTAPEIVKSLKRASAQSDVFSIGCLIHDYYGREERIPCQPIREDGVMGVIMHSCTKKNSNRRFQSIEILREALILVSNEEIEPQTPEGGRMLDLILSEDNLDFEQWETIVDFLSSDKNNKEDIDNLFKNLNLKRIKELFEIDLALGDAYGYLFAEWIRNSSFNFDFCDVLCGRLDKVISLSTLNTKSACILAMLILGTTHNRFYVEKICFRIISQMDDALVDRFKIELLSEGREVCYWISHLEKSISVNRTNFPPNVVSTINLLCD